MLKRNNKAFTVIEIVVVLIIVGLLAALAFTALFANINRSKEHEIDHVFSNLSLIVTGCVQTHSADPTVCKGTDDGGIINVATLTTGMKYFENVHIVFAGSQFTMTADVK